VASTNSEFLHSFSLDDPSGSMSTTGGNNKTSPGKEPSSTGSVTQGERSKNEIGDIAKYMEGYTKETNLDLNLREASSGSCATYNNN
jgi:hypothetical protein